MPDPTLALLNTPEIVALLALALIFFGAKKLPEMARGLGQGIREFKRAANEAYDAVSDDTPVPSPPNSSTASRVPQAPGTPSP